MFHLRASVLMVCVSCSGCGEKSVVQSGFPTKSDVDSQSVPEAVWPDGLWTDKVAFADYELFVKDGSASFLDSPESDEDFAKRPAMVKLRRPGTEADDQESPDRELGPKYAKLRDDGRIEFDLEKIYKFSNKKVSYSFRLSRDKKTVEVWKSTSHPYKIVPSDKGVVGGSVDTGREPLAALESR